MYLLRIVIVIEDYYFLKLIMQIYLSEAVYNDFKQDPDPGFHF